jgi:hypothetical protein
MAFDKELNCKTHADIFKSLDLSHMISGVLNANYYYFFLLLSRIGKGTGC